MTPAELARAIRTAPTDNAAAELLAEHDRELVAIADASQAAAVALARQSRAAEISAGLRRLARMPSAAEFAGALQFAADDIDNGRL